MQHVTRIGIDIAKNSFQLHGVDAQSHVVIKKRLSRKRMLPFFSQLPPCLIGMEATQGAHYWARELRRCGHTVKLMSAQFVKPSIKSNKNDAHDAEAICEAVSRPTMRFVPIKSIAQQETQALHRIRERQIKARTALVNQIRGLLAEYGIVLSKGIHHVRNKVPRMLEDADNGLSAPSREFFHTLYGQLQGFDQAIAFSDRQIKHILQHDDVCRRLDAIPGMGPIGATALRAAVGDAGAFHNGRQLTAWLGLVPRQHSTGGRQQLLGISKRGDTYVRKLLVHGARAVVRAAANKHDVRSRWLQRLVEASREKPCGGGLCEQNGPHGLGPDGQG